MRGAVLALGAILACLTASRVSLWARPLDFWAEATSAQPQNVRALVNQATTAMAVAQWDTADQALAQALRQVDGLRGNPQVRDVILVNQWLSWHGRDPDIPLPEAVTRWVACFRASGGARCGHL